MVYDDDSIINESDEVMSKSEMIADRFITISPLFMLTFTAILMLYVYFCANGNSYQIWFLVYMPVMLLWSFAVIVTYAWFFGDLLKKR